MPANVRTRHGLIVLCGAAITFLGIGAALLFGLAGFDQRSSPDPGHSRLVTLRGATLEVVGPGATVMLRTEQEPRWDACDGRTGTFGWTNVVALEEFVTSRAPLRVISAARSQLVRDGWTVSVKSAPGLVLAAVRVSGGFRSSVSLSPDYDADGDIRYWSVIAGAPPATGPRSHGC